MYIFFLIHLLCASPDIVSSGGFAAFLCPGGESISVVGSGGGRIFTLEALPGERLSYPDFADMQLVYISSFMGLVQLDILTGESTVISGEHTGAPWVSIDGDLWYTLNGYLFRNGVSTGISMASFLVSVEGGYAAYTDRADNLHILNMDNGIDRTVQGYRFYAPQVLSNGDVIAPSLTGEIIYLSVDGSIIVMGSGEQPSWSYRDDGLFYSVSKDDGHSITAADIWFVRPGEKPKRVTWTDDILETNPSCCGDILWYIDEEADTAGCVSLDDFSF